jgi:hypothetical protein
MERLIRLILSYVIMTFMLMLLLAPCSSFFLALISAKNSWNCVVF